MSNQAGSARQALANARAIRNEKIAHLKRRIQMCDKMQTQLRAAWAIGHKVCEAMLGRSLDTMAGECAARGTDQLHFAIEHLASKRRELQDQLLSLGRSPVTAVDPTAPIIREPGRTVTTFIVDCPPGCTCRGTHS